MKKEPLVMSLLPIAIITLLSVFLLLTWSNPNTFLSPSVGSVPGYFFLGIVVFGLIMLGLIAILVSYYIKNS